MANRTEKEREKRVQAGPGEGDHPHAIKSAAPVTDTIQVKLKELNEY